MPTDAYVSASAAAVGVSGDASKETQTRLHTAYSKRSTVPEPVASSGGLGGALVHYLARAAAAEPARRDAPTPQKPG